MVIHAGTPSVPAVATTYNWDATSLAHGSGPTFSIRSTDDNQDGLVQFGEEESGGFFGRTYLLFVMFYDQIEAVPVWSTQSLYTGGAAPEWSFGGPMGSMAADPSLWSYTQTGVAPIPASALLLGSGLLGLSILG